MTGHPATAGHSQTDQSQRSPSGGHLNEQFINEPTFLLYDDYE